MGCYRPASLLSPRAIPLSIHIRTSTDFSGEHVWGDASFLLTLWPNIQCSEQILEEEAKPCEEDSGVGESVVVEGASVARSG
jgi:hypothetical protein